MTLDLDPIWGWPLVLLAVVAMTASMLVGYPRRIRHLPLNQRRTLIGLRLFAIAILTFWMLRPGVISQSDDASDAVVYVLLDTSGSMNTPDCVGGSTRFKAMTGMLDEAQPYLDDLGERVELRIRSVAEQMTAFDKDTAAAAGKQTALGATLEELAKEAGREKIASVLLWSDGKQAASGALDVDPIQAARLLGRQHRPVYTVPFGSAEVVSTSVDSAVSDLDVPRNMFVRNEVPVKIRLKSLGAAGREVQIRLLIEDRTGIALGESGPMRAIPADRDNVTQAFVVPSKGVEDTTVSLQFIPQDVGEIKIAVEAVPLDDEIRLTNNRVETIVRIRSGGIRVAYFDVPRPEFRFLRSITDSSRVQLDALPLFQGRFASRNNFDESWFELDNYDAFIIGNVPASIFGPERLKKLADCCRNGAGLMMIGGAESFGGGGYHRTALAPLMPVVMTDNDQQLDDLIPMRPLRAALMNPILQIAAPDQNARRWNDLPPLDGANLLTVRQGTGAQVLAESPTRAPLLVSHSIGASNVLAFAGDTTWQWSFHEEWSMEAHQRFWRQVIFWLTKMENDGESPLWVNAESPSLSRGRIEELNFGLRDENGMPLANVGYKVSIKRPDGETEEVPARVQDLQGAADFANTMEPGDYVATVAADGGPGRGTLYASTRFIVNASNPELDNPAADPAMMREVAHVSGGDFLTPKTMMERLEDWANNGLPSLEMTRNIRTTLWDNWISLILFVLALAAEWYLRKKRGLV